MVGNSAAMVVLEYSGVETRVRAQGEYPGGWGPPGGRERHRDWIVDARRQALGHTFGTENRNGLRIGFGLEVNAPGQRLVT